MNEYPISTLASIFSPMLDEDFNKLVDSIKENGLLEPVTVWRGEIIDGKHRYYYIIGYSARKGGEINGLFSMVAVAFTGSNHHTAYDYWASSGFVYLLENDSNKAQPRNQAVSRADTKAGGSDG